MARSFRASIPDKDVEPILLYLQRARETIGEGELTSDELLLALLLVALDKE